MGRAAGWAFVVAAMALGGCSDGAQPAAASADGLAIEVADVPEIALEIDASVSKDAAADAPEPDAAAGDTAVVDVDTALGPDGDIAADADASADVATDIVAIADSSPDTGGDTVAVCAIPTAAGHHSVKCQGLVFDLHIPKTCEKSACGLVIDVHGATMDAAMQDLNTGMRALGDQHGYVVIQPNAMPPPPTSAWITADDQVVLSFTQAAIAALAIDSKRVHFTGFSQGGWMGWRFICKQPGLFASVAIGAACSSYGGEGCSFEGEQLPPAQLPILYMHGTLDVLQPWYCAQSQRSAMIKAWSLLETAVVSKDAQHTWQRYATAKGIAVEFIQHDYSALSLSLGGHCYPGSPDLLPSKLGQIMGFGCSGKTAFHWGEAAMGFFLAHPKP